MDYFPTKTLHILHYIFSHRLLAYCNLQVHVCLPKACNVSIYLSIYIYISTFLSLSNKQSTHTHTHIRIASFPPAFCSFRYEPKAHAQTSLYSSSPGSTVVAPVVNHSRISQAINPSINYLHIPSDINHSRQWLEECIDFALYTPKWL